MSTPIPSDDPAPDRRRVYAAAFVRALATGMVGVLIGIYLARRGFDPTAIGLVVTAGLAGAATAALLVTLYGDAFGRRRALVTLHGIAAVGAVLVVLFDAPLPVAAAAFLGMLNGMGRDRGASLILDQVILPATAADADRTKIFAWYNVLQDVGHAIGGLAAAIPALIRGFGDIDDLASLRLGMFAYAALQTVTALLYLRMSAASEAPVEHREVTLTAASRRILWRISSLFALDSFAGGFLTAALLSYFFFERFGVSEALVGLLFFGARVANAFSHIGAAWLASRIGLVNTMVFTHIPSSLLLVTVAYAPSFPIAAALFLLREGLVEMDVPTRQSYVMAVVEPGERTFASGVTHLVRLSAWAAAPVLAGWLMAETSLMTPLVIGAAMKIAYDVMLYVAFRHVKPPEESR
jgi:MFS family permease